MKTFALISGDGEFLSVYKTDAIDSILNIQNDSQKVIEIPQDADYRNAFYDSSTKEIKQKPDAPSPHHVFNYTTRQWEDPRTPGTEWPLVRAQRDALLQACDWTQLPDVPLATKDTWATYRQALRDITTQADPFSITWPPTP